MATRKFHSADDKIMSGEDISPHRIVVEADPAIGSFLTFLVNDMQATPDKMVPMSANLKDHITDLTEDMVVDIHQVIEGAVDF